MKKVFAGPGNRAELQALLEGYLYGLGEVCHTLFGPQGEVAMYKAIGRFFLNYLKDKMNISFFETDPWDRYCHIVEVFTSYGFYSHVELRELAANRYWMLETDQYAGNVWEDQRAWERGTPPCPLWAVILSSLSDIGYTIVLDTVSYDAKSHGYESTFHFKKLSAEQEDVIAHARRGILNSMITICANCRNIRDEDDKWVAADAYFAKTFEAEFSHGLCPACFRALYPGLAIDENERAN